MEEIWKVIEEFPDYQVSNLGRVSRKTASKNNHKVKKVLKPGMSKIRNPRPMVVLYKEGEPHGRAVARLVLFAFKGPPPREKANQCNHLDGNRANNCIDNVEWSSGEENIQHALKTGLRKNQAVGEKIGKAVLKETDIPEIRKMLQENHSLSKIGCLFGVNRCTIFNIKEGRTWKHI
jgi:hypothetical protein